jgi:hypothetical protein
MSSPALKLVRPTARSLGSGGRPGALHRIEVAALVAVPVGRGERAGLLRPLDLAPGRAQPEGREAPAGEKAGEIARRADQGVVAEEHASVSGPTGALVEVLDETLERSALLGGHEVGERALEDHEEPPRELERLGAVGRLLGAWREDRPILRAAATVARSESERTRSEPRSLPSAVESTTATSPAHSSAESTQRLSGSPTSARSRLGRRTTVRAWGLP